MCVAYVLFVRDGEEPTAWAVVRVYKNCVPEDISDRIVYAKAGLCPGKECHEDGISREDGDEFQQVFSEKNRSKGSVDCQYTVA